MDRASEGEARELDPVRAAVALMFIGPPPDRALAGWSAFYGDTDVTEADLASWLEKRPGPRAPWEVPG